MRNFPFILGARIAAVFAVLVSQAIAANNFQVIYSFRGGNDGAQPYTGLISDKQGNLYGMTYSGGNSQDCFEGCGTVYELVPNGNGDYTESVIYTFAETNPNDGEYPQGPSLSIAPDGTLYGTTYLGGLFFNGTIFALKNVGGTWKETILYNFTGNNDGGSPYGSLVVDTKGNLYGTASSGGAQVSGTVYELSRNGGKWNFKVIYTCCLGGGNAGSFGIPGPLAIDDQGNLYGESGPNLPVNYGSIFELQNVSGKWAATTLYNFCSESDCLDGWSPFGGLTLHNGNLYGTTTAGGTNNDGVIFELSNSSDTWKEAVVDNFTGSNGSNCFAGVTFDEAGNLYTDAELGGANGLGTVLQLTPKNGSWQETILHSFNGTDGAAPSANLLNYKDGLWGTTVGQGANGVGNVYEIVP